MNIIFIFIDGLGVGQFNTESNPCTSEQLTIFNNFLDRSRQKPLLYNGHVKFIDATLGVPGLPQSATGQSALLTGVNTAKILGRHLSGFPNQTLRDIIESESILTKCTQRGLKAAFINSYRPIFFEHGPEALVRYLSVTSIANWKAGLKFFTFDDLRNQRSIYHDYTNREILQKELGDVPIFSAEKAGTILAKAAANYDFCLYEYFKTDRAGHAQNITHAIEILTGLEKLILTTIEHLNLPDSLVIVTSDHGNIEDLSVKTHTRNPVPLLAWGKTAGELLSGVSSIQEIVPHITENLPDRLQHI